MMSHKFVLIDVEGDRSILILVQDVPGLDQSLDKWRAQDAEYIQGKLSDNEWMDIGTWLNKHGYPIHSYRTIAL